jgi:hypothetical protein
MVEITHEILLGARVLHAMMERHGDIYWSLLPPCVFVHPICICIVIHDIAPIPSLVKIISAQCSIDFAPLRMSNILRPKIWTSNDTQKLTESLTRFLDTMVPVPFP